MNKYCLYLSLFIGIVYLSGCVSYDDNEKRNDGTLNFTDSVAITPLQTDIISEDKQKALKELEYFIDPELKNIKIQCSNPDIEVIRLELFDNRDYEESTAYNVHALVSNNGDVPVYITADLHKAPVYPPGDIILNSGERVNLMFGSPRTELKHLSTLIINQRKTVNPIISPELINFNYFIFLRYNTVAVPPSPYIHLHSLKYEETKDEHKWKSVIVGVSSNDKGGTARIRILGKDEVKYARQNIYPYVTREQLEISIYLAPGKIEYVKVPLKKYAAEDVYGICIFSYPPPSGS